MVRKLSGEKMKALILKAFTCLDNSRMLATQILQHQRNSSTWLHSCATSMSFKSKTGLQHQFTCYYIAI